MTGRVWLASICYWLAFLFVLPWAMLRPYFGPYDLDAVLYRGGLS